MKKTAIIVIALLVVIVVGTGLWTATPFVRIRRFDKGYSITARGMTEAQVIALMGRSITTTSDDSRAWWDDTLLGEVEGARIASELSYTVNTFYLPVIFEFTFDAAGKLVGRHVYD
jgi:hypothetical protein